MMLRTPPMRFDYAGIRVRNLHRSIRFYTSALGLKVVRRGDTRVWGGGLWVLLQDPRSRRLIELNWYPKGSIFFGPYSTGDSLDHLDFTIGVADRAALERVHRGLIRHGARATRWTPARTDGWSTHVLDPDGVWITVGRRPTLAERRPSS
jgi:catechol 2,3-dioxygenase-like lactoylglutathione lyase family enzyme